MLLAIYALSAFLIYELPSITIFSILEGANDKKIHKYLADEGLKVDMKKWEKLDFATDYSKPYKESILKVFKQLIPIYNLIFEYKKSKNYNKGKEIIINQLKEMDLLLPMTEEELKKYSKKPTGYVARTIAEDSEKREQKKELSFGYHDKEGLNVIYFKEQGGEKIITRTEGSVSKSPKKEQYEILRNYISNLVPNANEEVAKLTRKKEDYK